MESNIRGGLGTRGKNSRGKERKEGREEKRDRRVVDHPFCF